MLMYCILPIVPILLYVIFYNKKNSKKNYTVMLGIFFLFLLLVSTFRNYTMGADYHWYVGAFLNDGSWNEEGFTLVSKTAHIIFKSNYWGLALIVDVCYLLPMYYFTKKFCKNEYILLVMLIFVLNPYLYIQSTFNVIRQSMACGFLIIAYYMLKKKKYWIFIVFSFIAASMHDVVKYFIVILLIVSIVKWKSKIFFYLATICLVANLLLTNLSVLFNFISTDRFDSYVDWGNSLFDFAGFGIVVFALLLLLSLEYSKLYGNEEEKNWVDLYLFSLCFLLIAVKNDIVYRLYMMLTYISLPAVGIIFKNLKENGSKYIKLLVVAYSAYYIVLYILFLNSVKNNTNYVPFEFYKTF